MRFIVFVWVVAIICLAGCRSDRSASSSTNKPIEMLPAIAQIPSTMPSSTQIPLALSTPKAEVTVTASSTASPSPSASSVSTLTLNPTIESFKKKGYTIEEKHVFTRIFEGIGEVTVTPVTTFSTENEFPISLVLIGGREDVVLTPNRPSGHSMFSSFEAIAFRDIDSDGPSKGFTDIFVIANFIKGVGKEGAIPYSDVILYRNNTKGEFVEDHPLEEKIARSMDNRTLTVKQVMEMVTPLSIKQFIGDYKLTDPNEYYGSNVRITRNDGKSIQFDVEAFKVMGGDEGIPKGNVHTGSIDGGIAEISQDKAIYKSKNSNFTMTFEFFPNGSFFIMESGPSEFGANVYASGLYRKKE